MIYMLLMEKEMSAADIFKESKLKFGRQIGSGSLYPILYELEKQGKITWRHVMFPSRRGVVYNLVERTKVK